MYSLVHLYAAMCFRTLTESYGNMAFSLFLFSVLSQYINLLSLLILVYTSKYN